MQLDAITEKTISFCSCQNYWSSLKRALLRRKKLHWPRLIWLTR